MAVMTSVKEMRFYAEAAAEQLTADPFHGIFEILQNADDVGAHTLRVAVRRGNPNGCLLLMTASLSLCPTSSP